MLSIKKNWDNYASIVYNTILDNIIKGVFAPGDRLNDVEISQKFGFSRTPAREALLLLEHDGFVKSVGKKGIFVSVLNRDEVREIYIVREALEAAAIRLGASFMSEEDLFLLQDVLKKMAIAIQEENFADYSRLDIEFHSLLTSTSKVKLLSEQSVLLNILSSSILSKIELTPARVSAYHRDHQEIFQALEGHDADLAEELIRRHIQHGKLEMMREMSE